MSDYHLHQLGLDAIIAGCQEESHQERLREIGHCFELFRRALEQYDAAAWAAIEGQYFQLMLGWVYAFPSQPASQDEAEQIAHEALERFWRTLTRRAISTHFAHVGALLKYLRQCVIATILDQQRRARRMERLTERLKSMQMPGEQHQSAEEIALEALHREEQLQHIRQWVQQEITDPQERRVLVLSYEHALTPAEIAAHYAQEFADTQTVRRIKERILKRARRALLARLSEMAADAEVNQANER